MSKENKDSMLKMIRKDIDKISKKEYNNKATGEELAYARLLYVVETVLECNPTAKGILKECRDNATILLQELDDKNV